MTLVKRTATSLGNGVYLERREIVEICDKLTAIEAIDAEKTARIVWELKNVHTVAKSLKISERSAHGRIAWLARSVQREEGPALGQECLIHGGLHGGGSYIPQFDFKAISSGLEQFQAFVSGKMSPLIPPLPLQINGHAVPVSPVENCTDTGSRLTLEQIVERIIAPNALGANEDGLKCEDYQKSFTADAQRKATHVIGWLKSSGIWERATPDKTVYLSIGGGDGSEIITVMKELGIGTGVLCEYMEEAAQAARTAAAAELKPVGRELSVLTGDFAQRATEVEALLAQALQKGATALIISVQAVLHELPNRADPSKYYEFQYLSLFGKFPIRALALREPIHPPQSWQSSVQLRLPGVDAKRVVLAAKEVFRHLQALSNANGRLRTIWDHYTPKIAEVRGDRVLMPGPLAVELLHKALRFDGPARLRHELEECLTGITVDAIIAQIRLYFQPAAIDSTIMTSGGFKQAYGRWGITAFAEDGQTELPMPMTHLEVFAFGVGEVGKS